MACSCNKKKTPSRVPATRVGRIVTVSSGNTNVAPVPSRNLTGMDAERRKVEKARRDAIRNSLGK